MGCQQAVASPDQEKLFAFGGGGVFIELGSGSVLQCGWHKWTFLKRGAEAWLGRDQTCAHSGPSSTEARLKTWFTPTESSWSVKVEGCTAKGLQGLPSVAGEQGAAHRTEDLGFSLLREQ